MAGTYDGNGKSVLAILAHQQFLAGYLVARILPVGIGKSSTFGYHVVGSRFVISRCRTDIDILAGASAEETDVTLYLGRHEADELADGIEHFVLDVVKHGFLIVDVTDNLTNAGRHLALACAAV